MSGSTNAISTKAWTNGHTTILHSDGAGFVRQLCPSVRPRGHSARDKSHREDNKTQIWRRENHDTHRTISSGKTRIQCAAYQIK